MLLADAEALAQEATPTPEEEEAEEEMQEEEAEATPEATPTFDTVQDPIEDTRPIGLELVAEGLNAPNFLTEAPDDSGRLFVTDQAGEIWIITAEGELLDEPFLDLSDEIVELMEGFDERGLLGLAFHPNYAENGRFFVYYSAPLREEAPDRWNHTSIISEFQVSEDDPDQADPGSEQVLLRVDQPQFNHDGGTLAFGPEDGYLYISLGDGGMANDIGLGHVEDWYLENAGGNAQDVEQNLLGSILRINVDRGDPFAIPRDNPQLVRPGQAQGERPVSGAVGKGAEVPEAGAPSIQYAYGFRNPFRFSFDMEGDHEMFVGDAGQNMFEEVSIVERGGNYGWNIWEGAHCFDAELPNQPPEECPDTVGEPHPQAGQQMTLPIIEYLNANQPNGVGLVVVGGYVYRGDAMSELDGAYIFGDWSTSFAEPNGRLFLATRPDDEEEMWPMTELLVEGAEDGQLQHYVLGFGQDSEGEVYLLADRTSGPTGTTGKVFRLVPPEEGVDMSEIIEEEEAEATPTPEEEEAEATPTPEEAEVEAEAAVLEVRSEETLGEYLVDSQGMSLYLFEPDEQGESTCYDACAEAWPPFLTDGEPTAGEDEVDEALLGTIERDDGTTQVTYNDWPLYYFVRDEEPGDTMGHEVMGFGGEWYLVTPEGNPLEAEEE